MHFEVGILIVRISFGRMIRSFVRWRGYVGAYSWRMMNGGLRHVPLLILSGNERSGMFMLDDRRMDDGRFWYIGTQNGFRR